jgi:TonB family protein
MASHITSALIAAALIVSGSKDLHTAGQVSDLKSPRKIKDVKPVYPTESLAAGDEGIVVIELKVGPSGSVAHARVIWSQCPALSEAALTAVRGWQYERVLVSGEATAFVVTTDVPFRLPEQVRSRARRPGACRWVDPPKPIR